MSVNRFTSAKAAFLHQGQPQQPMPKPTGAKVMITHQGQRRQPLLRPSAAKVAFMHNNTTEITASAPQQFTIYVRSFESSDKFAFPFTSAGDNRTFTTQVGPREKKVTARIHVVMQVDVARQTFIQNDATSSRTHQHNFPVWPLTFEQEATAIPAKQFGVRVGKWRPTYWFDVYAAEPLMAKIPVVGKATPAINLRGSFTLSCFDNKLFVRGQVSGDGFPDAECFIEDTAGNAILLATYKHPKTGSPLWSLPGDGDTNMLFIDAGIELTCHNQFVWGRRLGQSGRNWRQRELPVLSSQDR